MPSPLDTIVAPITVAPAAVGWVRLSGPEAWNIASLLFSPWPMKPSHLQTLAGRFTHGDEGLAIAFEAGRGYTGDQAVELSIHGSPASIQALVEAAMSHGARLAEPGEFTLRAFLNGKLDLSQAEAVRDTVEAQTQRQLRHANEVRSGAIRDRTQLIRSNLTGLLASVEASVDFEEEVGPIDVTSALETLVRARDSLNQLISTERFGRIVREGIKIALVGRPNVGKSSLFNRLLSRDRAIVSQTPGTTRDYIEETVVLAGLPCRLVDTAGIREGAGEIEDVGIEMTKRIASEADLVWILFDSDEGWTHDDQSLLESLAGSPLIIGNKCDLSAPDRGIAVSAAMGLGVEDLEESVRQLVGDFQGVAIAPRHRPLLEAALEGVELSTACLRHQMPHDLLSTGLQQAIQALGEVSGEAASDDILQSIFSRFCIGK